MNRQAPIDEMGLGTRLRLLLAALDGELQALYDALGEPFRPRFYPVARHLHARGGDTVGELAEPLLELFRYCTLSATGRTVEQNPTANRLAVRLVQLRMLKRVDDLEPDLLLDGLHATHVVEADGGALDLGGER